MIARVFIRKTNGTPDDPLAFIGMPDRLDFLNTHLENISNALLHND